MSGHQAATIEDTVYFWFAANDTLGSGGDGATPLFDVREAGAAASAIPLLSGTPTLLSHANFPAGCHEIAVAATIANGFAADDTFAVYCTLAIDSQNPTGFVGSCTLTPLAKQAQLDNLANVGSATNTSATTYVLTTGTQSSGTFANTAALDGTNHEHTSAAGVMDLYYEFNIGGGTPSSVKVTGYLNGNNDDLEVYGYDWIAPGWVQIGILAGKPSATNEVDEYDLFTSMVGVGANRGLVRIRFTDGAFTLTSATLAIDQIFVSYSASAAGYDGFIWFDSNASNTNTVSNVDGTSGNPVSSEAAVVTLSANLNINRVKVLPGSTYTLASTYNNYFFDGDGIWTLALGGQDVGGTTFNGATVSGVGIGSSEILFTDCEMGTATIHPFHLHNCSLTGTLTFGATGDYAVGDSHSGVAGSSTPIIDTGAAIANVNLTMPNYSQGIEIRNLNAAGTDLFSISGQGQIIYAASSSGAVNQRGDWKVTNTGGVTITADDNTSGIGAIRFNGVISIDTANGTSGTAFPTGTRNQPVDNIADALTIATAEGLDTFELRGSITLAAGFAAKELVGADENSIVALGSQDVSGTIFENVSISGTADTLTAPLTLRGSLVNSTGLVGFQGLMDDCRFDGNVTFAAGNSMLDGCKSQDSGNEPVTFLAGAALVDISVRGLYGDAVVSSTTNASSAWTLDIDSGTLTLAGGCTNGTVKVRGRGELVDNSGANCIVTSSALMDVADYQVLVRLATIYIDSSTNGNDATGTGTYADPVRTATAARTLADTLGIRRYHVRGAIQLGSAHTDWSILGTSASSVLLNGWSVDRSVFENITIYGSAAALSRGGEIPGSRITAMDCEIDNPNNLQGILQLCGFPSRFVAGLPGQGVDYTFDRCRSLVPAGDTNVYGILDIYPSDFGTNTEIMASWDNVALAQSFTGNGEKLGKAQFFASGSSDDPGVIAVTGTLQAKLYAHTGSFGSGGTPTGAALATSTNTINADDVVKLDEFEWIEFFFDDTFTLVDGTNYFISLEHSGHDGGFDQWIEVRTDTAIKIHAGNLAKNTGSWAASTNDMPFQVGVLVGTNGHPVIDLDNVTVSHNLQFYSWGGSIEIANMAAGDIDLGMLGGEIELASTMTGGTVDCHGGGTLTDNKTGGTVINNLSNNAAVMTTAMTEIYPVDGQSAMTPAQGLYATVQLLTEFVRSGAIVSVKKRDGITEAIELTLDSATAPTTSTQSS